MEEKESPLVTCEKVATHLYFVLMAETVTTVTKVKEIKEEVIDPKLVAEMADVGVLYGHKKSKTHPKMKPYVVVNRHEMEMMDAGSVLKSLEKAIEFLKTTLKNKGLVLFVGTTPSAHDITEKLAKKLGQPYVVTRWLGGTLTNFGTIRKRVDYYEELKAKQEKGELEKYTKKEQVDFQKKIERLQQNFEGITKLIKKPDALFVVDIEKHNTAVREARQEKIPVIAVLDTNDDPTTVQYPIIANDHARSSIKWVIERIAEDL